MGYCVCLYNDFVIWNWKDSNDCPVVHILVTINYTIMDVMYYERHKTNRQSGEYQYARDLS